MPRGFVFDIFDWMGGRAESIDLLISAFTTGVLLFVLFPIHELAHALAAKLLGDDTAERQGRLTLNPLAHLDIMGTIFILLFYVGWAKPVPVNPTRCRKVSAKAAMVITALAGPMSNILLSYVFVVISKLVGVSGETAAYLSWALFFVAVRSIFLAVFNLLPIPPLDGSYVLRYFLKPKWEYMIHQYQNIITMVFFMLVFATDIFSAILIPAGRALMKALDFLSGFAGSLPWGL